MSKILGIDTGTNSLGWAIIEKNEDTNESVLLDHGSHIFSEGVKIEKGKESSKAAERTGYRSIRRHYWRRKIRKIRLLTILSSNRLCPPLSWSELRKWRTEKVYPVTDLFMSWQSSDQENNPYLFRYLCLTEKLDLNNQENRYKLGRALYHINQRRGFLSNRKENTKESDGQVKADITQLSQDIEAAGCSYLGEYFYKLYQQGSKIRKHYTARNEHYLKEFHAICEKQELEAELVEKLEKAIFNQRPLKSQKQQVGKCIFEPKKSRCPISHPLFEEYRMYGLLNNIRVQTPADVEMRSLNNAEKKKLIPLFLRKSKASFTFEELAKKLAGKNNYCHYSDRVDKPYKFNYYMDTTVKNSPVTAQLVEIFGDDWQNSICETYTLAANKTKVQIINDIWHALYFFSDKEKLKEFAISRLQLDEEQAEKFSDIQIPQDYASLSLKAISKILPYMEVYGLNLADAIFLGNLEVVVPAYVWNQQEMREACIEGLIDTICDDSSSIIEYDLTKEQRIYNYLSDRYHVNVKTLKKLYHPSQIEQYPKQRPNKNGIYQLGSPRLSNVKNPMAMHSLFRLRNVVNLLLSTGKIDEETTVHIEFSRELNDANRRKAIQYLNRINEKNREDCRKKIEETFNELGVQRTPSDMDILKYQLWEEQNHKCIYTNEEIGLADFLSSNPKYDIEHTVPRSFGGDTTKANLTLCQCKFNREIKKAQMPYELANHEDILERISSWKERADDLAKQIRKLKAVSTTDKESKDSIIQKRHRLAIEREYWSGKYNRFTMTNVPEGFSRRQGTDISVISKYARLYLKTIFKKVFIVKGIATSDFRKLWGIQEEYSKKERVNHVHHCIDAITVACIGPYEYSQLAHYYHELEEYELYGKPKPQFPKPWDSFVNDIKHIQDELLVSHYSQDNVPKKAIRKVKGMKINMGDSARGSLHQASYYGAIDRDGEIKNVVRVSVESIKDINSVVDETVKQILKEAKERNGSLKAAIENNDIWMSKEKNIAIKKVRCFVQQKKTLDIRNHRDQSPKEYKRQYHVWNDGNYMIAIYEGVNPKGKIKREYEEVKLIDAARYYRASNREMAHQYDILPENSRSGYPLLYKLKIGDMVLFYENSPEEIWGASQKEKQRRLYKITGFSLADGRMVLVHQQEARPTSELIQKDGAYKANEDFREKIRISLSQFNALINGVDFELNALGEIKRLI